MFMPEYLFILFSLIDCSLRIEYRQQTVQRAAENVTADTYCCLNELKHRLWTKIIMMETANYQKAIPL